MSSVWNHAPGRLMVSSLRAAPLSSRSFRKRCSYSTSFRPIYPKHLDSPTNAFLNSSTSTDPGLESNRAPENTNNEDPSSCEFWCMSRLQSQLNQSYSPWATLISSRGPDGKLERTENNNANRSTSSLPGTVPLRNRHQGGRRARIEVSSSKRRNGIPDTPSYYEPSPSEFLIDTLQNTVLDSPDAGIRNWTISGNGLKEPLMAPLSMKQRFKFKRLHRVSLQEIIADYIQYVDPVLQRWEGVAIFKQRRAASELEYALKSMIRDDYMEYLASRNYDIADVMAWAWVLKSSTAYEATLRIFLVEAEGTLNKNIDSQGIPPFVSLILLRQKLDLKTFRLLLIYSLHLMSGRPIPPLDSSLDITSNDVVFNQTLIREPKKARPLIDPGMCATYAVRLLHHARQLWPEAQIPIARTFAFYMTVLETEGSDRTVATDRVVQFMAEKFNTCLRLLSLPCKSSPFLSVSIQQQAQFELLKAMASHQPVLPVTRRGYQGLIAVQLAHKKTSAERQTAELKAPSWPPWKEDKLGIDSQRGTEGMKSRAMRVMSQMKEAGYPHSRWEEVSGILAGWDTDHSPTIQTRTLIRRPETLHGPAGRSNYHAIWEARLRSTRTVREAWACFLAYENQGLQPHGGIYAAMAEKLVFRRKTAKKQLDQTSLALPGDGLEVFPEPASARDWIYTSTEPPTLNDLMKKMLSQGLRPGGRFLALLLRHAPNFRTGLEYISCSNLTNQQIRALCTVDNRIKSEEALDELPDHIFSSFIYFLCKFATVSKSSLKHSGINTADLFPIITGSWSIAPLENTTLFSHTLEPVVGKKFRDLKFLSHAIQLLRKRNSQNPQAWLRLLSTLSAKRILGSSPSTISGHTQMILAWHEILEVIKWLDEREVEIGFEGFQILCSSFSSAVAAGIKDPCAMEQGLGLVNRAVQEERVSFDFVSPRFEDMVQSGLNTLKSRFDRLVLLDPRTASLFEHVKNSLESGTDSQVVLPTLFRAPPPAALHAFVRSLGLAEDSDGLLSLLRWMSQHALALKDASDEYLNGDRMVRRTVVAIRLFLEGYWGRQHTAPATYEPGFTSHVTPNDSEPNFSDPALQEAYDIVTATEVWGPWPSDEEVWEYVTHGSH